MTVLDRVHAQAPQEGEKGILKSGRGFSQEKRLGRGQVEGGKAE